jgi:hypothetical protein
VCPEGPRLRVCHGQPSREPWVTLLGG